MRLSKLIEKLQDMKKDYGDAIIDVRNRAGEFHEVETIDATHYGPPLGPYKWKIFLDV